MPQSEILKPLKDERLYRHIELENKLSVLLISDAKADKAAAAMDVNAGFFCDPEDVAGLAHFCEHMLFLGTKKYPNENEYSDYLNTYGGSSNAFTSGENTNYYFDVTSENLEGALDRFAQFFIAPLFTQDSTDREMNVIDSEHNKNIQRDNWRKFQVTKTVSNPNHPYCKFGTGNLETLKKHPDIRERLISFHDKYYSSNIMKLVVLGKDSLDTLQSWVSEKFVSIVNKNIPVPRFNTFLPFTPEYLGKRLELVPIKDTRTLDIGWPVPAQHSLWKYKPCGVVGHLLGHEGEGSILALLKKLGLAQSLMAGVMEEGLDYSNFGVSIGLTEKGLENVNQVIVIIYQYIKILQEKGIEEWIFEEEKVLKEITFKFLEESQAADYASTLAGWMHTYPREHILSGPYLFYEFDSALVNEVLKSLSPNNMNVTVTSKSFQGKTTQVEQWYKVNYNITDIDPAFIKELENVGDNNELFLPQPNPFIPDDFSLLQPSAEHVAATPKALVGDNWTLWYKFDTVFGIPKAYQIIDLITPLVYTSPEASVMASIFCKLVQDSLNEFSYAAKIANLSYSFLNTKEGLRLTIKGYNCKQDILVQKVIEKIANFEVDPERFYIIQEQEKRGYKNFDHDPPYGNCLYETCVALESIRWHVKEYQVVCGEITLEQMKQFTQDLFKTLYIESFASGNITIEEAKKTINTILSVTKATPVDPESLISFKHVLLTPGKEYIRSVPAYDSGDKNSAIEVYLQMGPTSTEISALLDLFSQCVSISAYSELRTTQQLGYIVWSGRKSEYGVLGFRVIIQSDQYGPDELDVRIEKWIDSVEKLITELSEEEYRDTVNSIVITKREKFKSLKEQIADWCSETQFPRRQNFNRREEEAVYIEGITKEALLDFYRTYIKKGGEKRYVTQEKAVTREKQKKTTHVF
eukprot:TRINITY_DN2597_c0_g1_i1.p1 TRINITY_DN2597_c0_g1~~TRINITY_DN2597_c0_g1_i1.p1  ORF type:complete len:920 (-),score=181.97 TRINITY_DN2597_c0_g1_i1:22-2781(-)